ncbi:MAG TPA: GNAT family N-acetyltransferase [Ktedonobacteraceae bacterium]|jgi:ribosomal-protein-alanine N-acetyltransferase|nr:GNAT family N-acetyltransferase [Ktedonobacteraceae bacterium]
MKFTFTPIDEANARTIQSWNYEDPYNIYNWAAEDDISEILDQRSPQYAVKDEHGELIGFFAYGSSALVWDSGESHLFNENNTITIGLGMRPDLTGKGLGLAFVNAGLEFASKQFKPDYFRLFVLMFNQRAIRVYQHAGFQRVGIYVQPNAKGDREFLEMRKATSY